MKKTTRKAWTEQLEARVLFSSYSWTGTAGDGKWSTAANWAGGVAPSINEANAIVDFPAAASPATLNDDVTNLGIGAISFENVFTITGNSLTLNGTVSASGGGAGTFSDNVVLSGPSVTFSAGGSAPLTLNGVVSGGATLNEIGAGILTLSGNNTYTGPTTVSAGQLYIKSNNALGSAAAGTTISSGAALLMAPLVQISEPLSISGTGFGATPGAIRGVGDNSGNVAAEIDGPLTLAADSTLAGDPGGATNHCQINVEGNILGAGNLTIGQGIVGFFGNVSNTSTGNIDVTNNSLLYLDGTGSGVTVSRNLSITNGMVGVETTGQFAGTSAVNVAASGNLLLNSTNAAVASITGTGAVTGGGILTVAGGSPDTFGGVVTGSVGVTVSGGTALTLNGSSSNPTTGTLNQAGGSIILQSNFPNASITGTSTAPILGSGTVATIDVEHGSLSPGTPGVATLHVTGNATMGASSTFVFDTSNIADGALNVGGLIALNGGSLRINDNFDTGNNRPSPGTTYTLISNGAGSAIAGTFHALAEGGVMIAGNDAWRVSYVGGAGHDVVLTYLARTTATVVSTALNPTPPTSATLRATVGWSDPMAMGSLAGTVTFNDGATLLGTASLDGSGVATLQLNSLAAGAHSIVASYGGETGAYPGDNSAAPYVLTSARLVPVVALNVVGSMAAGASTSLAANVSSNTLGFTPTGQVTFSYGSGISLGSATIDSSGNAMLTTSALPAGSIHILATYGGDATFTPASSFQAPTAVVPSVSVSGAEVMRSTTSAVTFTFTLSSPSNQTVTIGYGTADGSAKAGTDYNAAFGSITFGPGETVKTQAVTLISHSDWQPARSFSMAITSASNAAIGVISAAGTIDSADAAPVAGIVPDELDPTRNDLVVYAANGNSIITVKPTKIAGQVQVVSNHQVIGSATNVARVVVYAGAGNQRISADPRLTTGVIFIGGAGKDTFTGGGANDILIGGSGVSTLAGGNGHNLLIAGSGRANLKGSRLGDILVGGATSYDAGRLSDLLALETLLNVWSDGQPYTARTTALALPAGSDGATLNGTTISNLTQADKLTGVRNRDWLIAAMKQPKPRHSRRRGR